MTPEEQIEKRRDSLTADYRNGKPFMGWTDLRNLAGLLLTRIAELTLEIEQLRALKADALELANYRAIDRGGGVSHD